MLKKILTSASLALSLTALPSFAGEDVEVDVQAKIDVQGKFVVWNEIEDSLVNNLNQWFGRAALTIDAKGDNMQGKLTIRAYPADFGSKDVNLKISYDTLKVPTGVITGSPSDYRDSVVLKTSSDTVYKDSFELFEAWTAYKSNVINMKFGRFWTNDRFGMAFGNYADEAKYVKGKATPQFMPAGVLMDAIEIGQSHYDGTVTWKVAFQSTASYLNKGDFRAGFRFSKLPSLERLNIAFQYRNNMFNQIKYPEQLVTHSFSAGAELPLANKYRFWGEVGIIGVTNEGHTPDFPITGGLEIPGKRIFDKVLLEAEWLKDRKGEMGYSSKDVLGSLFVQKKVGDNFIISFGVQNHGATKDYAMVGRLTGTMF